MKIGKFSGKDKIGKIFHDLEKKFGNRGI